MPADHNRQNHAFTLVEIMVVVVIIGLLAAIALPAFKRVQARSLASRTANDFRVFAEAFNRYNLENGNWPPNAPGGTYPAGMSGYLPKRYLDPSPIGGSYGWTQGTSTLYLFGTTAPLTLMKQVDSILDDGNLSTGDFTAPGSNMIDYRLH